jgi:hypothetical protein
MISVDRFPQLFTAFRTRWEERDQRIALMDDVVAGRWSAIGPDDEDLVNRSPNLIQVALEDTADHTVSEGQGCRYGAVGHLVPGPLPVRSAGH